MEHPPGHLDAGEGSSDDFALPVIEVTCQCRCGRCCTDLLIEVELEAAEREPRIAQHARPIFDDMSGVREQIGWFLNGPDGGCFFFERDGEVGRCSIYETRPDVCREFNCDEPHPGLSDDDSMTE